MGACAAKPGVHEVTEVSPGTASRSPASPAVSTRSAPTLLEKKGVVPGGFAPSQFILDKPGRIQDSYTLDKKKLGEGTYGSVCKGTHKATGAIRAVKTIAKGKMRSVERFKKEIAIMKIMDHPSIIKLYETFEDQRNIYLAMELCHGGELFDRIINVGHFTETQAAIVMKQILAAIFYMHEHSICHRDLKPENFLFQTKDPIEQNVLKIIDFGLSCNFKAGEWMSTRAGTPYYVAPQVLAGRYDKSCDLWSAGVIMYILLCGYPPFYGSNDQEVLAKVKLGNVTFNKDWKPISDDAKELVRSLVMKNPKDRFSAEQALNHQWIKHRAPKAVDVPLDSSFVDKLRHFRSQNKFVKAALHVIAQQLSEAQIKGLRDTFLSLDENSDGMLSLTEMKEGLSRAGLAVLPNDMKEIMDGVDADGSGVIDYTEFLAATLEQRQYLQEDVCWTAFRVFDLNGDGKVSKEELKTMLRSGSAEEVMDVDACADVLKEVDKNGDGAVDFQEFMGMLRGAQGGAPEA
jgi:calcium-dependent protein kinase